MANSEHLEILRKGIEAWNTWREENPGIEPDLREADLNEADLKGANLSRAKLEGANLNRANLTGAYLYRANLREAVLKWANLNGADLRGTYCRGADFRGADLIGANLGGSFLQDVDLRWACLVRADLTGADLTEAVLVEVDLENAELSGSRVFGVSAWKLNLAKAAQQDLVITPSEEPAITVDNLELAQFIYLLLHNEKIRDVINTTTSKVVLILGRFTSERKAILDAIREELRHLNYVPVLFDFDKPANRTTLETVTTLARLARFVIADITDPKSIIGELISIAETLPSVPIQLILAKGCESWGMIDHIKAFSSVLGEHEYRDLDDLLASLKDKVISPAERKAEELTAID